MASKIIPASLRAPTRILTAISRPHTSFLPTPLRRPTTTALRFSHAIPQPPQANNRPAANTNIAPSYELTFTCIPCGGRSAHNVSKQGYHHGSVLITCPSCRNRHVISDHLGIFTKGGKVTVEDLLREKGRLVKRGTLGEDGDLEFWEDGSTTVRSERQGEGEGQDPTPKPRKENGEANGDAPGSTFGQA